MCSSVIYEAYNVIFYNIFFLGILCTFYMTVDPKLYLITKYLYGLNILYIM